jgi:hypothetical protein
MRDFTTKDYRVRNVFTFITEYKVKDNNIYITYTNKPEKVIPYSKEAELDILKQMKQQVYSSKEFEEYYEKYDGFNRINLLLDVAFTAANVIFARISRYPDFHYILAGIFATLSLYFGSSIYEEQTNLEEIKKLKLFLENEELIREDTRKHYEEMYGEINPDEINYLTINNIDGYSYKDIKEMVDLIKKSNEKSIKLELK